MLSSLRLGLLGTVVSLAAAGFVLAAAAVVVGEVRLTDLKQSNRWLAVDIASQFSVEGARLLAKAQRYGSLLRADLSGFEPAAEKEFAVDTMAGRADELQGVYVFATGASEPLARLQKAGFELSETQARTIADLSEKAMSDGSGVGVLDDSTTAFALKLGDSSRVLVMVSASSLMTRAIGGPLGEKWMLLTGGGKAEATVLKEATSVRPGAADVRFPSLSDLRAVLLAPSAPQTEFSMDLTTEAGQTYHVTSVQTGAFNVSALAISPVENSFQFLILLTQMAVGFSILVGILLSLLSVWRRRRAQHSI